MSDINAHTDIKMGTDRGFGIVFGSAFLIVALLGLVFQKPFWPYVLAFSAFFYGAALWMPSLLHGPNVLWFRFGLLLHSVVSPVVMFLIFAIAFVPIGLLFRLRGKDVLDQEIDKKTSSYWKKRTDRPGSMTRQF